MMLKVVMDSRQFQKEINNIMNYSAGFLDGIQKGKMEFYASLAPKISELAAQLMQMQRCLQNYYITCMNGKR